MKKLVLLVATLCICFTAVADEGMWLLPYLQKMNIKTMKERGCKLTAEEIYSADKSSLKDAIVIFGNGCTGEIVSAEGLLLTNHHCGYGSIQSLSSVENDYLKNGFWAMSRTEEIPAPGLKVRFIRKIVDVTPEMVANVPDRSGGEERVKMIEENNSALIEKLSKENPGLEIDIKPFFGGNQYFAFVVEVFADVRLVGAPPTSIGKFGGDTDNWMWPRHTGDFSIFRIYAGPDNKPAAYAPENIPYKTKQHLKISLGGYNEGDFAMIMGFPGTTKRYMTSYEIDRMLDVENPQRIYIRGERQDILKEEMAASDEVRIQYASKYASSSNYWKNSVGMSRGIRKLGVKAQKEAIQEMFRKWAAANTLPTEGYIDALDQMRDAIEQSAASFAAEQYLREALVRPVEIMMPAGAFMSHSAVKFPDRAKRNMGKIYKNINLDTDRRVAKRMMQIVRENVKDLPTIFAEVIDKEFGGSTDAYVDYLYDNSVFANPERLMEFIDGFSTEKCQADPMVIFAQSLDEKMTELAESQSDGRLKFADAHRRYISGLMLMQPKKSWSSDANSTIRLTYGRVLPYDPADGISYNYYTTLKGVIDKENPENPTEFTVPEGLKELYAAKDFGRYANASGELPVAFLADCDITGGNSGSPIMNASGELLGLAFDGNWEAMSGDVAFEPELQRTISVDIRYVLFLIDKFAGAGWLLDEMDIR